HPWNRTAYIHVGVRQHDEDERSRSPGQTAHQLPEAGLYLIFFPEEMPYSWLTIFKIHSVRDNVMHGKIKTDNQSKAKGRYEDSNIDRRKAPSEPEQKKLDRELDEALKDTFPASDPVQLSP
ncbi:MAG: hypothetical protein WD601_09840, partial [Pseudohongiellaceae bacterium]